MPDTEYIISEMTSPFPMNEFDSYLYGLIVTDGCIYLQKGSNKGKVTIELQRGDEPLLLELCKHVPSARISRRTRDTNFKDGCESSTFAESNGWFRGRLFAQGMMMRNKSIVGAPPNGRYVESAFWRGVFDGNGSNGMTSMNKPFISLTTKSEPLKEALCDLLEREFGIKKNVNRNKRDGVYNIMLSNEHAIEFMDYLYDGATIWLERKHDKYLECKQWKREPSVPGGRRWTPDEDAYVIEHSVKESVEHLGRTYNSVYQRKAKLKRSAA